MASTLKGAGMERAFFRQMEGALSGEVWNIFKEDGRVLPEDSRKMEEESAGRGWFKGREQKGSRVDRPPWRGWRSLGVGIHPAPSFSLSPTGSCVLVSWGSSS